MADKQFLLPVVGDTMAGVRLVDLGDGTFAVAAAAAGGVAVPALSAVASLATSQQLLAANAARKGLLVQNTAANTLKLKYGATASASSFSVNIPGGGYWEMPQPIYAGRIDGIWDAVGTGSAFITELT